VPEPLVLHVEAYWRSPWDYSVFVALREKRLEFATAIAMMRPGVGALDALSQHSLTGTAPVLQHGGLWLAESLAILDYLEEAFPPPGHPRIFPADLRERARARQICSWIRTGLDPLRRERPVERILFRAEAKPAPLSPAAARIAADLLRVASRLGASASGALFGEFGVVDADLALALMRLLVAGDPLPAPVRDYVTTVWARTSVREFVEHSRPPHPPPVI
jgi:glutathione S-transferase